MTAGPPSHELLCRPQTSRGLVCDGAHRQSTQNCHTVSIRPTGPTAHWQCDLGVAARILSSSPPAIVAVTPSGPWPIPEPPSTPMEASARSRRVTTAPSSCKTTKSRTLPPRLRPPKMTLLSRTRRVATEMTKTTDPATTRPTRALTARASSATRPTHWPRPSCTIASKTEDSITPTVTEPTGAQTTRSPERFWTLRTTCIF